ncbi:unnamed protein product [Lactuca virosa]|uniref:Uncharacterized protein n=1 Tax=Lactuca virosa TaxID=75947 RepID=A0AAU9LSB8_9ASTR|nr:unnamed protein product [Lactuca virosa]
MKSRRAMKTTIDRLPILTLSRDWSRGRGISVCSSDDVSLSLPTSSIERRVARSLLGEGVSGKSPSSTCVAVDGASAASIRRRGLLSMFLLR